MTSLHCKQSGRWGAMRWIVLVAMLFAGLAATPRSEASEENAANAPIEITADQLITDNAAKSADFTGNVHAVQGDTAIKADRLILFYGDSGSQTAAMEGNSIERMEAFGHVQITFDNRVAVSDQAVYITKERKLVLKGPGSKIISGKDQVEGSTITFYRNDGKIALEGGGDNRVKVTIHSEQRGLN